MSSHHEIHSIFVEHEGSPAEIYISRKYKTEITDRRLRITAVADHGEILKDPRVASFTCLFGENGCGKTKLMMDVADTFSEGSRKKQLGVLFSVEGVLYLHRGRALANLILDENGVHAEQRLPRDVPIVFYTSSPFDSDRRKNFKRLNVADMTPMFGTDRSFEGLSLILHCDEIGGVGATITQDLKIAVRGGLARERSTERLLFDLLDRFAFDENNLLPRAKRMFAEWLLSLSAERKQGLTLDLIIISDIEYNQNVAGKFVGDLMRLASSSVEEPLRSKAGHIADLARAAIIQSNFIMFTGGDILQGLDLLRQSIAPGDRGSVFGAQVTPTHMRSVLNLIESEYPGLSRFMAQLGFLNFKLSKLSSGETAFLYLFGALGTALDDIIAREVSGPVWLMLDEGEMFMHPAWQREYLQNVLDFIGRFQRPGLDIHLIVSTHSLIVAADAPPKSLFNVQEGQRMNGFGLGPSATLSALYGVKDFAGENASPMVEELAHFLRDSRQQVNERILALKDALADVELRRYVESAILTRTQS
jgi:hypothetical protein